MRKPKVATIEEIAHDQLKLLEQLELELDKNYPDNKEIKKLLTKATTKSVAINGLLRRD